MVAEQIFYERTGTMTVKRVSNKEFAFKSWVNVKIGEDDKDILAELTENPNAREMLDWIANLVYSGYSFSVSWDEYSGAHQVSLVCKVADDPNFGFGMSARHPDFVFALITLRYKHEVICGGNWSTVGTSRPNGVWD
jgi:hypothetical protein